MADKKYKDLVAECRKDEITIYVHNNGLFDLIQRIPDDNRTSYEKIAVKVAKAYDEQNPGLFLPIRVLVTPGLPSENRANPSWYDNSPFLFVYDKFKDKVELVKNRS